MPQELTDLDKSVIELYAQGDSYKEISRKSGIRLSSVGKIIQLAAEKAKNYRDRDIQKLSDKIHARRKRNVIRIFDKTKFSYLIDESDTNIIFKKLEKYGYVLTENEKKALAGAVAGKSYAEIMHENGFSKEVFMSIRQKLARIKKMPDIFYNINSIVRILSLSRHKSSGRVDVHDFGSVLYGCLSSTQKTILDDKIRGISYKTTAYKLKTTIDTVYASLHKIQLKAEPLLDKFYEEIDIYDYAQEFLSDKGISKLTDYKCLKRYFSRIGIMKVRELCDKTLKELFETLTFNEAERLEKSILTPYYLRLRQEEPEKIGLDYDIDKKMFARMHYSGRGKISGANSIYSKMLNKYREQEPDADSFPMWFYVKTMKAWPVQKAAVSKWLDVSFEQARIQYSNKVFR